MSFLRTAVLCALVALHPLPAAATGVPGSAEDFIRDLAATALVKLGEKGTGADDHNKRFQRLLTSRFDLPRISRFVLGRYWRRATDDEREEFVSLFEKFTTKAYANRFRDIGKARLDVLRSREVAPGQEVVHSQINFDERPPIKVDWLVRNGHPGGRKIIDVVIEGVSMRITFRDEFASVIRQSRGRVAGLLAALRKKTGG